MLRGDISNEFLNQHGLSYTGTTEKADFSSLCIGGNQINHLDSRFQNLLHRTLIGKLRRFPVNLPLLCVANGILTIDGFSKYIKESSKGFFPYRNGDSLPCGNHLHISLQAFTGSKHDATNRIVS